MGSELELLAEVVDHGFNKASWHGPNLASSFRGLDAQTAARRIHGRKSIWEQVLHTAYWKQRVLNKLVGTQRFPRPGSNWPRLPQNITASAWKADQQLLHGIHRQLRAAVADLNPARLWPELKRMIYGVAAHDVYHAGQIRLLRKLLGEAG